VICDTNLVVSWRTRPRGFVALMGLYESNYLRLAHLAGRPRDLVGVLCSAAAGDCPLQLTVLERAPYTSDLRLTYLLRPDGSATGPWQRVPDLRLKAYHDAGLLEVCPDVQMTERELHQCWSRNLMLNKWLEYCADRGHRFG
jgi:uncharacterized protein YqiB (DUF1249 family)